MTYPRIDPKTRRLIIRDLTPAIRGTISSLSDTVDDVKEDREDRESKLARYLADLIKILIYEELIEADACYGDDGLSILEIMEILEKF